MYCPMYMPPYMPPQNYMWGQQPPNKQQEVFETAAKLVKLMKKADKEDKKKKSSPPKGDPFTLFIFLTVLSPIVGPGGLYIMSVFLKMTFENLQAIVH